MALSGGIGTSFLGDDTAFTAARSRDHWFYIDDRDLNSKRALAFMQILLSLAETGGQARGPVVSLIIRARRGRGEVVSPGRRPGAFRELGRITSGR